MKYDANGVHPDPEKVHDLRQMPTPTTKTDLQTFMQFLAPFIPNLSDKSAPLRDLLENDSAFTWESHHQSCFDNLKSVVTERSTLRYFDTSKMPSLHVDASIKGLGARTGNQSRLPQNRSPMLKPGMPASSGNYWPSFLASRDSTHTCMDDHLKSLPTTNHLSKNPLPRHRHACKECC